MSTKKPLVIGEDGNTSELVSGDRVYGAGCVPTRVIDGDYFHVPQDNQALYSQPIRLDGTLYLDGILVEVK